jgi:hypothetical protein
MEFELEWSHKASKWVVAHEAHWRGGEISRTARSGAA